MLGKLRFGCVQCGRCCLNRNVYVSNSEIRAIDAVLGPGRSAALDVAGGPVGGRVLKKASDGACIYLGPPAADGTRRCTVYDARPSQCRSYPFVPAAMLSSHDWMVEASRCPGIESQTARHVRPREAAALALAHSLRDPSSEQDSTFRHYDGAELVALTEGLPGPVLDEFATELIEVHGRRVAYQDDTVVVVDSRPAGGRHTRSLHFRSSPDVTQSEIDLVYQAPDAAGDMASPGRPIHGPLTTAYQQTFLLAAAVAIGIRPPAASAKPKVLVIGAGGGVVPKALSKAFAVVAVDICSAVIDAARDWFGVDDSPTLSLRHGDGLELLRAAAADGDRGLYHLVILDVDDTDGEGRLVAPGYLCLF